MCYTKSTFTLLHFTLLLHSITLEMANWPLKELCIYTSGRLHRLPVKFMEKASNTLQSTIKYGDWPSCWFPRQEARQCWSLWVAQMWVLWVWSQCSVAVAVYLQSSGHAGHSEHQPVALHQSELAVDWCGNQQWTERHGTRWSPRTDRVSAEAAPVNKTADQFLITRADTFLQATECQDQPQNLSFVAELPHFCGISKMTGD